MRRKDGFTLAELLIVVAIIAVLVTISIPVFTTQLEKSREATDLANVRSAYAKLMTCVLSSDTSMMEDNLIVSGEIYKTSVDLTQKSNGWQSSDNITLANISSDDTTHWLGSPKKDGSCTISYNASTNELFLNWDGYNIATNLGFQGFCWNGGSEQGKQAGNMISTYNQGDSKYPGKYELEPNTKYEVSFTYDPKFDNPDHPTKGILGRAILLWNADNKNVFDSRSGNFNYNATNTLTGNVYLNENMGPLTYNYIKNNDGTVTYHATFTTPSNSTAYYFGMNFGGRNIASNGVTSGDLNFKNTFGSSSQSDLQSQILHNFVLKKA